VHLERSASPSPCRTGGGPGRGFPRLSLSAGVPYALAIACCCALPGCRKKAEPAPAPRSDIIAHVDRVPITIHDFIRESEQLHAVSQAGNDPAAFLERLIDREALISLALNRGVQRDPDLCRQYENLLIGTLRERVLTPRLAELAVTDAEVQACYEQNQDRYRVAGSLRLAILRLQCRGTQQAEAKTQLTAVREQLAAESTPTTGFGKLAIANSDHQASRYLGGDIGWLRDRKGPPWLPAEVAAAAWQLTTPGQLSEVIVTEHAVFLLRLLELKDAGTRPLAEVAPAIQAELLASKRRAAEAAFVRQAREAVTVTVQQPALADAAQQVRQRAHVSPTEAEPPAPPP
jgi:hypothetical protein